MTKVVVHTDWVGVIDLGITAEVFIICDDCREAYLEPPYYEFDPDGCTDDEPHGDYEPHGDDCTGNVCPDCAGPYLDPDNPGDPRRPSE